MLEMETKAGESGLRQSREDGKTMKDSRGDANRRLEGHTQHAPIVFHVNMHENVSITTTDNEKLAMLIWMCEKTLTWWNNGTCRLIKPN